VIDVKKLDIVYIVREEVAVPKIERYHNHVYHNVIEGLQAIKDKPHVVFIDLGLNRVTGIDCLKMIRSNPFNHQIKIIVCAKKYDYNLIRKSFNLGADFFVQIPFDINEIKYILHDIKKNMQYFSLEDIMNFSNFDNLAYQNQDVEI